MMFKSVIRYRLSVVFVAVFAAACSSANNKPLSIRFNSDSTAIQFDHIDPAGLHQMNALPPGDSTLYSLISVLQTPSENDSVSMEQLVEGKVSVTDSNIVFRPDISFVKGHSYLVISHLNIQFGGAGDVVKGRMSYNLKPYQVTLVR